MQLSIFAIGKMKKGPEAELLQRYVDRADKSARQLGISGVSLIEHSESRAGSVELRKREEATLLLDSLKPGAFVVALDEHGKDLGSQDLSKLVKGSMENAIPEMAFALGGPDGHGPEILDRANLTLRMGTMTWPHQLARVMVAEQVYRVMTILSGHPYHRV